MEFYGIFIPVPENWIGIFHLDSRSRKMGMEFAISRSRSRSPKVIPAHGCMRQVGWEYVGFLHYPTIFKVICSNYVRYQIFCVIPN